MNNETVPPITQGQFKDLAATLIGVIPELSFEEAETLTSRKGEIVAGVRGVLLGLKTRIIPALNQPFELTLDGDAPENQPLEMVRLDGYDPQNWKYQGTPVKGKQTRRFKLVSVGPCTNFTEVQEKLKPHGEIPEGQWGNAFKKKFPKMDGNGPIGVADLSWVDPHGCAYFPFVLAGGASHFRWAAYRFGGRWRWLVASK